MRTIVGLGMPVVPPQTTDPRYLVAGARPLVPIVIDPVWRTAAVGGTLTVMLPAAALPSSQVCSLNGLDPTTPQPWTTTVQLPAAGASRFTSSAEAPEPLLPTCVPPLLKTHRSMSAPTLTSSNSEKRA